MAWLPRARGKVPKIIQQKEKDWLLLSLQFAMRGINPGSSCHRRRGPGLGWALLLLPVLFSFPPGPTSAARARAPRQLARLERPRHDDREKERELLSGSGALTLAGPAESLANARCLSVWAPAEWNSNCRRLLAAGATVRRWQGKDQGTPRLLRALGGPEGQGWRWCSTRRSRRRRCCEVRTHHQHAR